MIVARNLKLRGKVVFRKPNRSIFRIYVVTKTREDPRRTITISPLRLRDDERWLQPTTGRRELYCRSSLATGSTVGFFRRCRFRVLRREVRLRSDSSTVHHSRRIGFKATRTSSGIPASEARVIIVEAGPPIRISIETIIPTGIVDVLGLSTTYRVSPNINPGKLQLNCPKLNWATPERDICLFFPLRLERSILDQKNTDAPLGLR